MRAPRMVLKEVCGTPELSEVLSVTVACKRLTSIRLDRFVPSTKVSLL